MIEKAIIGPVVRTVSYALIGLSSAAMGVGTIVFDKIRTKKKNQTEDVKQDYYNELKEEHIPPMKMSKATEDYIFDKIIENKIKKEIEKENKEKK